jgi:DNA-binding CsgD family transcriptional regulator
MTEMSNQQEKWVDSLAKLIESIGSTDFYDNLGDALESISPYEDMVIVAYSSDKKPFMVFQDLSETHKQNILKQYLNGGYLFDPFYEIQMKKPKDGVYRLVDVAPDEFYSSEYYQNYYTGSDFQDEIGFIIKYDEEYEVIVWLGIQKEKAKITSHELSQLEDTLPIVIALCHQHWQRASLPFPKTGDQFESEMGLQLTKAFNNFATDFLSNRECEIVRLILKGYSSKAIAQLLEISPDTVKVHRKHVHLKLDVSSQAELFSLFLSSLSLVEIGSDVDPLTLYFA